MGKIGIFDSGYGGLTVLSEIKQLLPSYSYIYLGDNARTPYGSRSFETVYQYTLEAVKWLFDEGCELIILACNTASAKALRNIQQNDLPKISSTKRVLGVIRPVTEVVGTYSNTGKIGLFGTKGTVKSESYTIEINKQFPNIKLHQEACPMWVPLVENGEAHREGTNYFIKQHCDAILKQDDEIDTIILGCTHYPILKDVIQSFLPDHIKLLNQPEIVAKSLKNYLSRHPEIESRLNKNSQLRYCTTDCDKNFSQIASIFLNENIDAEKVSIND